MVDYINGEQLELCRLLQEQLGLTSIQMEKLVIFLAVLNDDQKKFALNALLLYPPSWVK